MTLDKLERDLYWAYERASVSVISRGGDGIVGSGGANGDLYELVLASATLQNLVENLPTTNRIVTKSKYGRDPDTLKELVESIVGKFGLPETAAQMFIARWLGIPLEVEMQSLTGILSCSKSTISKKCTKICVYLDKLNLESLYELRSKILDYKGGN